MVKIRGLKNGWLVTHATYRVENYSLVEDGGFAETAFVYDMPDERAACWAKVAAFVATACGMVSPGLPTTRQIVHVDSTKNHLLGERCDICEERR